VHHRQLTVRKNIVVLLLVVSPLLGCSVAANAGTVAKSPLSLRLVLSRSHSPAGVSIPGVVIITNSSSRSVKVYGCSLREAIAVGISSRAIPFEPVTPTPACFGPILIHSGVTRLRISVSTTYQACSATTPSPGLPLCTNPGMPALPKGTYRTSVIYSGLSSGTRPAARVTVTLT
jgi:hypothetical protein